MNFREKGFRFERYVASEFGLWWCNDPKALWRNTNSGGRATTVKNVYSGDIVPVNDSIGFWPLTIEVKKSEQWSIDAFVNLNPSNQLLKYMIQCLEGCDNGCNTIPILICAKNHRKPLCFIHKSVHRKIGKPISYLGRLVWPIASKYKINFYFLHLDKFFTSFCKEDFL